MTRSSSGSWGLKTTGRNDGNEAGCPFRATYGRAEDDAFGSPVLSRDDDAGVADDEHRLIGQVADFL